MDEDDFNFSNFDLDSISDGYQMDDEEYMHDADFLRSLRSEHDLDIAGLDDEW